ncbi:MAG: homoserine O-acetyltransferase [Thalassobium sp.]|nr:MAG: homoserine O-acetyltransferase [Thalassobium sp.]
MKIFLHNDSVKLENGAELPGLEIAYHTYGEMNADKSNVVWICHALTANSDAEDWWEGLVGDGKLMDPSKYFIVCANILGSCYGSSGPMTNDPSTGEPYYSGFPDVTIRDMVNAHELLRVHLGVDKIWLGLGGSMGGYQILEWACSQNNLIENMVLLVTGAKESAWAIAVHEAQRLAIEADNTWRDHNKEAGRDGLIAARGIGMLTYRNYETYVAVQSDDEEKLDDFKAASYIKYQGNKLADRFNAYVYWLLTKSMDSHNLGRGRGGIEKALTGVTAPALVIGIESDILCPVEEQKKLAAALPNGSYIEIKSGYGHDGFLIESDAIHAAINAFLS